MSRKNKMIVEPVYAGIENKNINFVHGISGYNYEFNVLERYTLCAIREDNVLKIGMAICKPDENFIKALGRNEAATKALNGIWKIQINDNDIEARKVLYSFVDKIDNDFSWFRRNINKNITFNVDVKIVKNINLKIF